MTAVIYAPPNQEKTAPEYATIEQLKERLGIELAVTDYDDRLTLALITAEIKIEEHLGRSFPDRGVAIQFDEWKSTDTTLAAADGEASASIATQVEMSLTSYNEINYASIADALEAGTQIIVTSGDFIFDVTSAAVENPIESPAVANGIIVYTGTVSAGTFPTAGELHRFMVSPLTVGDEWLSTVPDTVEKKSINLAMLEFKKDDSPLGVAGSDAFMGELDMSAMIKAELNDRTLLGLKVSWGVA